MVNAQVLEVSMKKVLTLSRELGSGGIALAQSLAKRIGWKLIDKEVISEVAQLAQCSEKEIAKFDQEEFDRIKMLFNDLSFPVPGSGMMFPFVAGGYMEPYWLPSSVTDQQLIDESKYLQLTKSVIQTLADKGDVIIVGRGGSVLLAERPDAFHLRVIAPTEHRIKQLMEVAKISEAEAKQMLQKRDKASADYIKYFYHEDWTNPRLYHMVLNTGKIPLPEVEEIILHCLE
jgi:cytidylate kinase